MSVAKVTEITASSPDGIEQAIKHGVKRAGKTLDNITGAWVDGIKVDVDSGKITAYRAGMFELVPA